MKKAAIITIVDKDNYGNRLQNYAVQETLKKHKYNAIKIVNDYENLKKVDDSRIKQIIDEGTPEE